MDHRERVAREKKRAFEDWTYWGRPVPGFGDTKAELVIVGLAPAAHGGNRTGRVFTGDPSATFLMRGLHEAGFANQPTSRSADDGLRLRNAYMNAAVRCVPPDNKPLPEEIRNCAPYLWEELDLLRPQAILTLGSIAYDAVIAYLADHYGIERREASFRHGAVYHFGGGAPSLFVSYHPSPRNTQTGLLTRESFQRLLERLAEFLGRGS